MREFDEIGDTIFHDEALERQAKLTVVAERRKPQKRTRNERRKTLPERHFRSGPTGLTGFKTHSVITIPDACHRAAYPAESMWGCAVRRISGHQLGLFFVQSVSLTCLTL